jgi:alkanesulfonate monooxygenase SsuD/methylene tetrahydromethanopterin reductase-like flavin-dependent oxidoreductase (luciferase family)
MTRTDPDDVPRPDAQLHLGVFFQGVNYWTIWSDPASGSQISPESYRRVAQTAERGLFDAFFLGEGLRLREVGGRIHDLDVAGRPDAITQLSALAAVTDRIGLVSTTNTTFNEPADLARRLSGLDLLSDGRAGWNVVTTDNAWTGENFRRGGYLDHADRYKRAEQFLAAARAIWDGGTETVRVRSEQFSIDVPPTLPRSRQGHPVIFQAGDSGEGRDFAARNADVIFSAHGTDFDDALAFADDIRARLRTAGRPEDDLRILPGTSIVVGETAAEAEEKAAWVRR